MSVYESDPIFSLHTTARDTLVHLGAVRHLDDAPCFVKLLPEHRRIVRFLDFNSSFEADRASLYSVEQRDGIDGDILIALNLYRDRLPYSRLRDQVEELEEDGEHLVVVPRLDIPVIIHSAYYGNVEDSTGSLISLVTDGIAESLGYNRAMALREILGSLSINQLDLEDL